MWGYEKRDTYLLANTAEYWQKELKFSLTNILFLNYLWYYDFNIDITTVKNVITAYKDITTAYEDVITEYIDITVYNDVITAYNDITMNNDVIIKKMILLILSNCA